MGMRSPKTIEDGPIPARGGRVLGAHGLGPMPGGSTTGVPGESRLGVGPPISSSKWASTVEDDVGPTHSPGADIARSAGGILLGSQLSDWGGVNSSSARSRGFDDPNAGEMEERRVPAVHPAPPRRDRGV